MDFGKITKRIWKELLRHVLLVQDASCEFNSRELAIWIVNSIAPQGQEVERFRTDHWLTVHNHLLDCILEDFPPRFIGNDRENQLFLAYPAGDGQRVVVIAEPDGKHGLDVRFIYVRARPLNHHEILREAAISVLSREIDLSYDDWELFEWAGAFAERIASSSENDVDD